MQVSHPSPVQIHIETPAFSFTMDVLLLLWSHDWAIWHLIRNLRKVLGLSDSVFSTITVVAEAIVTIFDSFTIVCLAIMGLFIL